LYARATSIDQKCDLDRHMPAVTWAIRFRPGMLFWELVNSLHGDHSNPGANWQLSPQTKFTALGGSGNPSIRSR
jgi:hypothetical protein